MAKKKKDSKKKAGKKAASMKTAGQSKGGPGASRKRGRAAQRSAVTGDARKKSRSGTAPPTGRGASPRP